MDGWMDGSPGGVKYRAAYAANKASLVAVTCSILSRKKDEKKEVIYKVSSTKYALFYQLL